MKKSEKVIARLLIGMLIFSTFVFGIYFREFGGKVLEKFGIIKPHKCPEPPEPPLTPDFEIIDNGDGTFTIRPRQ